MISDRVRRLRKNFLGKAFDGGVVTGEADIRYLTGALGGGVLYLDSDKAVLFPPPVNFNQAYESAYEDVECREYEGDWPFRELRDLAGNSRIFFEPCRLSQKVYSSLKELGAEPAGIVSGMRMIKDSEEVMLIRKSCSLAAEILGSLDISVIQDKTEADLAGLLENMAWKNGLSGSAFRPVVASGVNSAYPHHLPCDVQISDGWLVIDYGVVFRGYASDLTRTHILTKFVGNFNSERLLSNLRDAKNAAVKKLRPGVVCGEVYEEARSVLGEYGLDRYFSHGLGHGIGLEVHERPWLRKGDTTVLEESMVVTVEPGFYIRGSGGMRLEDSYLITSEGRELLTRQYP